MRLRQAGFEVVSADGNPNMLAKAFENGRKHDLILRTVRADWRWLNRDIHGKFDAVIVATPDHTHAPIMLTAFQHDKHVYGQKPLVHQLEELVMMEKAIAAKPHLVTQLGNQRMVKPGRRAAAPGRRREFQCAELLSPPARGARGYRRSSGYMSRMTPAARTTSTLRSSRSRTTTVCLCSAVLLLLLLGCI